MSKYKLVALFGYSGAGKDTLLNYIVEKYPDIFNKVISFTTRPMRENEINNKDYHFVSVEEFTSKVLDGSMIEATEWDGHFYGSNISAFDINKINIEVLDEKGIDCLIDNSDIELYPIFITARQKTRLMRALQREENPDCEKICRRFFKDIERLDREFDFEYYTYYNGDEVNLSYFEQRLREWGILSKNT